MEVKRIINEDEDSCIFYTYRTKSYSKRELMGKEKGGYDVII